jgi:hypothetical protein
MSMTLAKGTSWQIRPRTFHYDANQSHLTHSTQASSCRICGSIVYSGIIAKLLEATKEEHVSSGEGGNFFLLCFSIFLASLSA